MCFKASHSTKKFKYSSSPELLAQHKTSHQSCASGSTPNTSTHTHTHIICNWLMPSILNKSSCSYAMWSSTQYIKLKHQGNIIINGLMPISVRSKIWDITSTFHDYKAFIKHWNITSSAKNPSINGCIIHYHY